VYIYGNLKTTGSNITFGNNATDNLTIKSQTNIKNKLLVDSDISCNGNIFVNKSNKYVYVDNIDSLSYGLNGFDICGSSVINIANNTNIVNIGSNASIIEIGRDGCDLRLHGNYSAPIVQPDIHIYLNTLTSTKNASLAGVYIKEGYPSNGNTGNTFDAAYMITSYDRNKFKFKAPNSNNVVALNVNTLTLPQDMNSGILVINRNPFSNTNLYDNDICYNMNVSTYDISNVVVRDKLLSTTNNQVIPSNISILGNMSINQPANYVTNSILDISGNISQRNGFITQF